MSSSPPSLPHRAWQSPFAIYAGLARQPSAVAHLQGASDLSVLCMPVDIAVTHHAACPSGHLRGLPVSQQGYSGAIRHGSGAQGLAHQLAPSSVEHGSSRVRKAPSEPVVGSHQHLAQFPPFQVTLLCLLLAVTLLEEDPDGVGAQNLQAPGSAMPILISLGAAEQSPDYALDTSYFAATLPSEVDGWIGE